MASTSVLSLLTATFLLILLSNLALVSGGCCKNTGKFSCCGKGKCNVFCCACKGACKPGCKFDPTLVVDIISSVRGGKGGGAKGGGRGKRDVRGSKSSVDPVEKFRSIDSNGDGFVNLDEADMYKLARGLCASNSSDAMHQNPGTFRNDTAGASSRPKRTAVPGWFAEVDTDGDGRISFQEFDFDH